MAVLRMLSRRGIFCIVCRSRRGMDRCGQLLRRRARAWAHRPARGRSDTANLFVGAAACARAGARLREDVAEPARWRVRRRWLRRLARHRKYVSEGPLAAPRALAAFRPATVPLAE